MVREFAAVWFTLQRIQVARRSTIRLHSDCSPVVHCLNRRGSMRSLSLWDWSLRMTRLLSSRGLALLAVHIWGVSNVLADGLSRFVHGVDGRRRFLPFALPDVREPQGGPLRVGVVAASFDNKPEECSVCYNNYDDSRLRPRTLPCGHTFCSQCIDNAIENGQLTCPNCRAQHAATAATRFPISYAVEALVRKLKDIQLTQKKTVPVKKKLHSLVQKQKSSISSLITSCEEVLSQLGDWKTHHLQLQDRLYALVEQNKSAMKLLELEDTSVVDMTTQGEEGKTQLQAMLGSLDTVNTPQEVDTTIDTADECSMKIEDWLQKCQELFPDVKTVHTSVKVQETIREALEMTTTETGTTADPVHLGDSASSIMNKVQEITGEIPQKQLTVEDLRRMREPVKRLVEAGRVLAVQEDQDGRRSARITLQDEQLYLHPLLRQPMLAHAHTLQRGYTYRNTKLLRVWGKGQPGEWVEGGDYESNDGKGGAPLLPDLQGQYRESGQAGAVWARWEPGGPWSAQFAITTRDLPGGGQFTDVFGDVVSGLDVGKLASTILIQEGQQEPEDIY
ncbi:uncharacterized protein [Procambarus clarkii]|uniref:uncharacterized protein n=1 Tax=Procambarus clarkii TaxID=6728 RepID=UPI003743C914